MVGIARATSTAGSIAPSLAERRPAPLDLDFHHVGQACDRIRDHFSYYQLLGFSPSGGVFHDAHQQVRGQFWRHESNFVIELLEPDGPDSRLHTLLRRKISMYHQAYTCADIEDTVNRMTNAGGILWGPLAPSVAFDGRRIGFVFLSGGIILEFIESPGSCPSSP